MSEAARMVARHRSQDRHTHPSTSQLGTSSTHPVTNQERVCFLRGLQLSLSDILMALFARSPCPPPPYAPSHSQPPNPPLAGTEPGNTHRTAL
jgi:hypothetical protein